MEVQHIFLVNQNWKDINPMECGQERCARASGGYRCWLRGIRS